ncbi:MAG: hypothetical protein ACREEV_12085 [Dongiaceae bacterium]
MCTVTRIRSLAAVVGLAAVVAGCTYRGNIDNPVVRKATWFSYLDGTDIRAACGEGAPDSLRLVYNARYQEQVRSYEIAADGTGGAYLVARSRGGANAFNISLDDPFAPWRWRQSEAQLSPAEYQQLLALLEKSGQFAGAPAGLRLFSGDFYWVGSACRNGVFSYHAWLYSKDGFADVHFADFLFKRDRTEIAVNPPRRIPAGEYLGPMGRQEDQTQIRFWLQVREDGLGGIANAF